MTDEHVVEQVNQGLTSGEIGAWAAILTLILTVAVYLVRAGRKQGNLETDVRESKTALAGLREDYEKDIKKLREDVKENFDKVNKSQSDVLRRIDNMFLTNDGDPRFITHRAHEKECSAHQNAVQLKLDHLCGNVGDVKQMLLTLVDQQHELWKEVADLKGWKDGVNGNNDIG